jgi:hypothetical protein
MGKPALVTDSATSDIRRMNSFSAELVAKSKGTLIAPKEVLDGITRLSPQALQTLEELMLTSKADSVRLKAALEVLAMAGVTKETRLTLSTETHDLDDSQIDDRLTSLLRKAGRTVIEADVQDVTEIEEDQ